jgi:hypothetical protein
MALGTLRWQVRCDMTRMRNLVPVALCTTALAGVPACSSGNSNSGSSPDAGGGCAKDPLVDPGLGSDVPVVLPMKKPGAMGKLSFAVVNLSPNPVGESSTAITIQVFDGSGSAATDATVSIPLNPRGGPLPWMPYMKHGYVPAEAKANGNGTFTIPMLFNMNGVWQLTIDAQSGSVTDRATFTWCVP